MVAKLLSFTEKEEVTSDGEGKIVEIKVGKLFEEERTPLYYTRSS